MFSSFSTISVPFGLARLLGKKPVSGISLESVDIHEVETLQEKRARTLKHLIKLNHVNHAILFHNRQFHNHLPHVCEAYFINTKTQLNHKCSSWGPPTYLEQVRIILANATIMNQSRLFLGRILQERYHVMTGETISEIPGRITDQFHQVHEAKKYQLRAGIC